MDIYKRLLEYINNEKESFETLISADNVLGLNVTSEDIFNYLEFHSNGRELNSPIIGNIIITEGDILSVLKIIHDITNYNGEYILYINEDNIGTITYLVSRANMIYKEFSINVNIRLDYNENYNAYVNNLVTIIGSEEFVNTAGDDFPSGNKIVV